MQKYYDKLLCYHERIVVEIKSRRVDCETIKRFYCNRIMSILILQKLHFYIVCRKTSTSAELLRC
jgi:hypothetical protein